MNNVEKINAVMAQQFSTETGVMARIGSVNDWREAFSGRWFDYELREHHTETYGFPILTKEVAVILAKLIGEMHVLDVGAGTGYISAALRYAGVLNIKAIDLATGEYTRPTWWDHITGKSYFPVGNCCALDHLEQRAKEYDVVLLSWPEYDTPFGANVLKAMRPGQILIYQGETRGGCTGDDEFFEILDVEFYAREQLNEQLDDCHVRFHGIHDRWAIYVKK